MQRLAPPGAKLASQSPPVAPANVILAAISFHLETFGAAALEADSPVLEAFVAEADLAG